MLAGGPAAEVGTGEQNAGPARARLIQLEILSFTPVLIDAPIKEKKRPEAGPLDSLEELLGDDLVGVDVRSAQGRDAAPMTDECLHELRTLMHSAAGCAYNLVYDKSVSYARTATYM